MPKLIAVEGLLKGKSFQLQKANLLGRSFDTDIRLDDLSISRHHAQIVLVNQNYIIEDLGSGNGTFVNDERIQSPTPLRDGDLIRFANNVFCFAIENGAPKGAAVSVVDMPASGAPPIVETLNIKATMMDLAMTWPTAEVDVLRKVHQRFRAVVEISNAVQTQLDMDRLLSEILDRLFTVFPQADRGFIMLKADEGEELIPRAARQRGRDAPEAITVSRSIIDKAVNGRVAILSADAMSDQRFAAAMSVMNFQIRSMMCAPVIANEETLGIIHLDTTRQDRRFNMDDLDLLTGVANQTAFAIANARMHRKLLLQQRTERDLQFAREVQESFLPGKPPELPGIEFSAFYKAALEVGGDFYNFIPLPGGKLGVVVGDVAGKGIPAALMMAKMTSEVRFCALTEDGPSAVAAKLNGMLAATNIEGAFVTLIFGILDPETRTFRMVNAAHPPPILRRGLSGEASEIQSCTNFPIGAVDGAEFEPQTFQLAPGDVVCLYSDGITEAMNASKELYGVERLKAAVAMPAANAQQVMENILKDTQSHVGSAYPSDDLTLVCFGAVQKLEE